MSSNSTVFAENSDALETDDQDTPEIGLKNRVPFSIRQQLHQESPGPSVIPASDDECDTPVTSDLGLDVRPSSSSSNGSIEARVKTINGQSRSFEVELPAHCTSTPMVRQMTTFQPLNDRNMDMTAIAQEIDEIEDQDNDGDGSGAFETPIRSDRRNIAANRRRIISSSSSDEGDSKEADKSGGKSDDLGDDRNSREADADDDENGTVAIHEAEDEEDEDILTISQRVGGLELGGGDAVKKRFNFEKKKPQVVELDSDSDNETGDEFVDAEADSTWSGANSVSVHLSSSSDLSKSDSPEVIYEQPVPRRVIQPQQPKKQDEPRRMQFIDLPESSGPHRPLPVSTESNFGVKNVISKLAEIIENIPKEDVQSVVPTGLRVELYDHQKYGLEWLSWREKQFPGGGILADEMGLGKTVMIIALALKNKLDLNANKDSEDGWIRRDTRNLVPSRSTLVIVPPSVMGQWEDEIRKKARGAKVYSYHGPKRTTSAALLVQHDFVLTTYQTVGSEIPKSTEQLTCNSPLLRIRWDRIVLDEGHVIRNAKTQGAQAVYRLNANHRWVVTGTPVHNKPADLQSLVKFLRLEPFDDQKVWDFYIGMKLVSTKNTERLNIIGKALILRRTKEEVKMGGGNVKSIPTKTVIDVKIGLSMEERQVYDHLYEFAESQFKMFLKSQQAARKELQNAADNYVAGGRPKSAKSNDVNFTHMFTLLLRLRQASVHPYLITTMLEEEDATEDAYDPMNQEDIISRRNPVFSSEHESAKLRQLYQDLEDLRELCEVEERPMEKVVIVSQWTTLLDVVRVHLSGRGFTHTTISGQVKIGERMDIMGRFNSNPKRPQIMLLSLAAGGVGLNLVGANHLFFLDIHWNPQLELQAQDRIHRFGQTKKVTIKRYISEGTMEERVLALQSKKLDIANGLLSNSKKKVGTGLSIPEMRMLFDL